MNVETITMPKRTAQRRLQEYRESTQAGANLEYEAAARGYRALARGKALVDLAQVWQRCPFDEQGLPKLALARADHRTIEFSWHHWMNDTIGTFSAPTRPWWQVDAQFGRRPTTIPKNRVSTIVPLIPPSLAPARTTVRKHFILWEVESWTNEPPVDPYLLTHLAGSLYVIEGAWDLTELERAIIRGRSRK